MIVRTCRRSKTTPQGCGHYSYSLSRCRLGKINPPTFKGALDAEKWMGMNYVCQFSKWREKLNEHYRREVK